MSVRQDIEIAVKLITQQIQNNIGTALLAVSVDRNDGYVPLPIPKQYFNYKGARCDQPPSVFVVPGGDDVDYKKDRGANFIFATASINTAIIVENQRKDQLQTQSYRYLAALLQILDQVGLTAPNNAFRLKVIVQKSRFLEDYTESTKPDHPASMWRKGVELELDVEFYEQLQINGGS
jgi:hypothetical protein